MLIQFSVGNYLSFKDIMTLSLVASAKKELEKDNAFSATAKLKLLKSAVIYGANASGKSNLIKAMSFFKVFVLNSSKEMQVNEFINIDSFKFSTETENKPSYFEIVFMHENIRYRYGFQVDNNIVHTEWLFYVPKTKEVNLFLREKNDFKIGANFKKGKDLIEKTRPNSLFLSVAAQFNGQIAITILNWLSKLNIISGLDDTNYIHYSINKLQDSTYKALMLDFLKAADLGINDISVLPDGPKRKISPKKTLNFKETIIKEAIESLLTTHNKYDKNNKITAKEMLGFINESKGTQKLFSISAPVIDTLKNGKILIVDELDARLHPILTLGIIKLFNSKKANKNNAQLIFSSHDTTMLNRKNFRRDQVWFMEKNKIGATDLYSLIEYKIRKDASFDKDYIAGKYGAIPYLGDINHILSHNNES